MLDESSLQFSGQLVANLERPNLQDVTGVVESGESRAKHDSNFARPGLALEMDRFAPDCDRRVPVVLCEKVSAAVRYRENQTDCFAFSGSGRASSCGLLAPRHFIRKFDAKWAWRFPSGERTRPRVLIAAPRRNALGREKFAMAGTPSPAREARALPRVARHALMLFSPPENRLRCRWRLNPARALVIHGRALRRKISQRLRPARCRL